MKYNLRPKSACNLGQDLFNKWIKTNANMHPTDLRSTKDWMPKLQEYKHASRWSTHHTTCNGFKSPRSQTGECSGWCRGLRKSPIGEELISIDNQHPIKGKYYTTSWEKNLIPRFLAQYGRPISLLLLTRLLFQHIVIQTGSSNGLNASSQDSADWAPMQSDRKNSLQQSIAYFR